MSGEMRFGIPLFGNLDDRQMLAALRMAQSDLRPYSEFGGEDMRVGYMLMRCTETLAHRIMLEQDAGHDDSAGTKA